MLQALNILENFDLKAMASIRRVNQYGLSDDEPGLGRSRFLLWRYLHGA